jgi:hypothetical protein
VAVLSGRSHELALRQSAHYPVKGRLCATSSHSSLGVLTSAQLGGAKQRRRAPGPAKDRSSHRTLAAVHVVQRRLRTEGLASATPSASRRQHRDSGYSNVASRELYRSERARRFYLARAPAPDRLRDYEYEYTTVTAPNGGRTDLPSASPQAARHARRRNRLGYNWLLGPNRTSAIGLGFGVTRLREPANEFDFYDGGTQT